MIPHNSHGNWPPERGAVFYLILDGARGLLAGLAPPCRRVDGVGVKLAFEDGRYLLPLLPYLSGCAVRIGVALRFTLDSGRAEQGCADDRGGCSVVVAVLDFAVDLAAATFFLGPRRLWRRHRSRSRGWRNHRSRPWNWRGSWRHVSRLVLALRLFAGLAPAGRRVDGTGVELAPCRAFLHSEFNCRARGVARAGCSAVEIGFVSC